MDRLSRASFVEGPDRQPIDRSSPALAAVGRNDPCPCGSGKRYKDCHGSLNAAPASAPAKVDFLIAGAQKGGTSAIADYLHDHPEVCVASRKEVHFFDAEKYFLVDEVDYSQYLAYFKPTATQRVVGEATPIYMYWEPAPRRIWQYNPAMKIIIILRNPVMRAFSHWNMERHRKRDPLPFYEALLAEPERCRKVLPLQHRVFSYIDRGFYSEQLRRIWRHFPIEQTLVVRNEELRTEPENVLPRIADFLGIGPFPDIERRDVHSMSYEEAISPQAQDYLLHVFEYEIRQLERMLGWDCADWLDPRS